jgi:D-glycero-D-manno-heptose 1,7-bisphosphate phosphatase
MSAQVAQTAPGLHIPRNSRLSAGLDIPDRRAVFLDRDGVIIRDVHFLRVPSQLELMPGAAEALRLLGSRFYLVVVTNQSGIARGFINEDGLLDIHAHLTRQLAAEGAFVDAFYYCPHLPDGMADAYRVECECRKPKPGMLRRAAVAWGIDLAHSYTIGDRARDIHAGAAAGLAGGILIGRAEDTPPGAAAASDLLSAARMLLDISGSRLK